MDVELSATERLPPVAEKAPVLEAVTVVAGVPVQRTFLKIMTVLRASAVPSKVGALLSEPEAGEVEVKKGAEGGFESLR